MQLPAKSREFCWRNWIPIPAFRRIHHRQHNHARWIFNRRLAEQEAACYGENCRVQSNSQSQRENYGESKSWILAQHAPAVPQILDDGFDDVHPSRVAALLFGPFDSPKLHACSPQRFWARHATAEQILGIRLQVETQFRV